MSGRGEQEPIQAAICSGYQTPGREVEADQLGQPIGDEENETD